MKTTIVIHFKQVEYFTTTATPFILDRLTASIDDIYKYFLSLYINADTITNYIHQYTYINLSVSMNI